jgi:hypothetical protein
MSTKVNTPEDLSTLEKRAPPEQPEPETLDRSTSSSWRSSSTRSRSASALWPAPARGGPPVDAHRRLRFCSRPSTRPSSLWRSGTPGTGPRGRLRRFLRLSWPRGRRSRSDTGYLSALCPRPSPPVPPTPPGAGSVGHGYSTCKTFRGPRPVPPPCSPASSPERGRALFRPDVTRMGVASPMVV